MSNNAKLAQMDEIFNEFPEIQEMVNQGSNALIQNNLKLFKNLELTYIGKRQIMFFTDEMIGQIKLTKPDPIILKIFNENLKQLFIENPYLEEENLRKEFRIQCISYTVNGYIIEYYIENSKSKEDLMKKIEKSTKYLEKTGKFLFLNGEKKFLLKNKYKLMNLLNIKSLDFNMNFSSNSLIQVIEDNKPYVC